MIKLKDKRLDEKLDEALDKVMNHFSEVDPDEKVAALATYTEIFKDLIRSTGQSAASDNTLIRIDEAYLWAVKHLSLMEIEAAKEEE